jgi:DnaJ-class molecular chaperone
VIKQIVVIDPNKDPRVIIDNEDAALIPEHQRCQRCGGTGNELLFMYRQCQACGGDGFSQGNEEEVKERIGN